MTKEEREVLDILTGRVYIIMAFPKSIGESPRRLAGRFNDFEAKRRILVLKKKNQKINYYIAHYKDPGYSLLTDIQTGLLDAFGVLP